MKGPRRAVVAFAAIVLLALGAGLVRRQLQLRPLGHVEVALDSLGPHPLQPELFLYELRIQGVTRRDDRVRASFRFRTRRGSEWSDVATITTQAATYALSGGEAHRLPETLTQELHQDRWGNEVERVNGGSFFVNGWQAPAGLDCMTWRTAFGVGASAPDELELQATFVDADGDLLPVRASALVPAPVVTARPTIRLAEPR